MSFCSISVSSSINVDSVRTGEIGALVGSSEVQARGVDSVGSGFKDPAGVISKLAQRESESLLSFPLLATQYLDT